jgi:hypothetical protein
MSQTPTRPPSRDERAIPRGTALLAYFDDREVVLLPGAHGSRLVVDRLVDGGGDPRLVAHLTSDEPDLNAIVVTDIYLADPGRRARRLSDADLDSPPPAVDDEVSVEDRVLRDRDGNRFHLAPIVTGARPLPEVRWLREPPVGVEGPAECVSCRRVVGALEDYEPVRRLASAAICRHRLDPATSVATLGLELRRLGASPIILNRRLREAVIEASVRRGVSLSSIALACGRVKYDQRGCRSGETSWLTRRVGLAADEATRRPTPWVHTEVLALIARSGLGLAPHEVELG